MTTRYPLVVNGTVIQELQSGDTLNISVANTQITGLITSGQIATVANTQITGLITSGQIATVANTQITGLITSGQIASVANTQITGLITSGQIASVANTQITGGLQAGALSTPSTFTATQSFTGSATSEAIKLTNVAEAAYINTSAIGATATFNLSNGSVQYYTSNSTANTSLNITWSPTTTLNTAMNVGDSVSIALLYTNGTTGYYPNVCQIDGVTVSPKWQANSAPTIGNASSVDMYGYTIIKTAATPTYSVFASQTQFK
jgi:hypothetical protein